MATPDTGGEEKSAPKPDHLVLKPALQQLHDQLRLAMGKYDPGHPPVVYTPVQTRNDWSSATLGHEEIHQLLTKNTLYGVFSQVLSLYSDAGLFQKEYELCLEGEWGVQEATATYAQLVIVVANDPKQLEREIEKLPTAELDQPPYREWFDEVATVLPMSATIDSVTLVAQASLVYAAAVYALNSEVLTTFDTLDRLNAAALANHLREHSPDARFRAVLSRLKDCGRLEELIDSTRSQLEEGEREGFAMAFAGLLGQLYTLSSEESLPDDAVFGGDMESFLGHAKEYAAERGISLHLDDADTMDTATVRYLPDWVERFPDAFPLGSLDLEMFGISLSNAGKSGLGFCCAISMYKESELHLAAHAYPMAADRNPTFLEEAMDFLDVFPTSDGIFPANEVMRLFETHPRAPLAVIFMKQSWQVWDRVAHGRKVFENAIQAVMEVELSDIELAFLLNFRDLGSVGQYVFFQVHDQQYAACFFDPKRPGIYGIQGIAGNVGVHIFDQFVALGKYKQQPPAAIPHFELVRLIAQGLLL